MSRDPEMRESKVSCGNKARMFNVEGKGPMSRPRNQELSLKNTHGEPGLAGQNPLQGPSRISHRLVLRPKGSLCLCQMSAAQRNPGHPDQRLLQLIRVFSGLLIARGRFY